MVVRACAGDREEEGEGGGEGGGVEVEAGE